MKGGTTVDNAAQLKVVTTPDVERGQRDRDSSVLHGGSRGTPNGSHSAPRRIRDRMRAQWIIATIGLLVGFVLFLVGSFALVVWWRAPEFVSTRAAVFAGLSTLTGAILFQYFGAVRYATQKRLAPDAFAAVARDPRPPILFGTAIGEQQDRPMPRGFPTSHVFSSSRPKATTAG